MFNAIVHSRQIFEREASLTKYVIRCDMEGVTGVVSYAQAEPGGAEYAFGLRMFMADLMAAVEGLLDGGADEVVVYDEHYFGRNVDLGVLPSRASVICGKPTYRPDWAGGLDGSCAGLVLLGFHSKRGTPGGLLNHTYEPDIRALGLNGVDVGEIGVEAAVAGDYGVPLVLITGDSAGVEEAQTLVPGVRGVVVKESLGETGGRCYPVSLTSSAIRAACRQVAASPPPVQPYHLDGEVSLEVTLNDGPYLDAVRQAFGGSLLGERSLVLTGETATAVWADYWQKKLHCQALVAAQEL